MKKCKANADIRLKVKEAGLYLWEVSDQLGITDATFCRRLRHELPDDEKTKIFQIIAEFPKGGEIA